MAGEDGDYMGDLSLFLATEDLSSSKKKPGRKAPQDPPAPKPKKPKGLSWQEQRRLDRERQQREEDERTMAGLASAIPASNVGFKMLRKMGYDPSEEGARPAAEPVGLEIRRSRAGIGVETPAEKKARRERATAERRRMSDEEMGHMAAEFGSWQRTQWRSRKIVGDFRKAEAAMAQLENREVVEPPKKEDGEEAEKEEEEEEEITEEDLHDILMKLRDEHHYCLYCGCQYESAEAMAAECPGPNDEDH